MEKEKVAKCKADKTILKEKLKSKSFDKMTASEKWEIVEMLAKMFNIIE